jgi:hypothetical protein
MEANLRQEFSMLSSVKQFWVHLQLCRQALAVWQEFVSQRPISHYVESVCGTMQFVDLRLPANAIECVVVRNDIKQVERRYGEPMTAMQDDDLTFPDNALYAYYAIYNCFRLYATGKPTDPWLIVNQALSCTGEPTWDARLFGAIEFAEQQNQSG